jgi:hypothetical protein
MEPAREYAPELNAVERLGLTFLQNRINRREPRIRRWSREEVSGIRRIERRMVGLAALSGAVIGGILGLLEFGFRSWMMEAGPAGWQEQLPYWTVYMIVAVLVSGAEILYLYWLVLRNVARIGSIAGLGLSSEDIEHVMAVGLTRAALGLPNSRTPIYGIDPYARTSRWKLAVYSVLYRLKVGATSFLLRVMLRRVLARAALRFVIPLAAIPVFVVWNGLIIGWMLREARTRAAGPVAIQELAEWIAAEKAHLDESAGTLLLASLAEAVTRSQDAHPNFVLLLTRLFRELEIAPDEVRADWTATRAALADADPRTQDLVLAALTLATMLDGAPGRAQRRFLQEAHGLCGRSFRPEALRELHARFMEGQGLDSARVKAVGAPLM